MLLPQIALAVNLPYHAIGRLILSNQSRQCTATLVGKDLVVTTEHCRDESDLRFEVTNSNGDKIDESNVTCFYKVDHMSYLTGVRFYKIDKDLGSKYGYFGWKGVSGNDSIQDTKIVGYPSSESTQMEWDHCNWVQQSIDKISIFASTNCPSEDGMSGAPVLQYVDGEYKVIAVVGGKLESNGNAIATPSSYFIDLLSQLRQE